MKRDIEIPEVKEVYVAVVREENKDFRTQDWNAYLINDRPTAIDTILIVTRGYNEVNTTSTMRHSLKELPPQSYAKIEFLEDNVLQLNNEFSVSFFADGKMLHKKYIFRKNSINERALQEIPVMKQKGVLVK